MGNTVLPVNENELPRFHVFSFSSKYTDRSVCKQNLQLSLQHNRLMPKPRLKNSVYSYRIRMIHYKIEERKKDFNKKEEIN